MAWQLGPEDPWGARPLGTPTSLCYMKHIAESKLILALSNSGMGISVAALLFAEPHSISLEAEALFALLLAASLSQSGHTDEW